MTKICYEPIAVFQSSFSETYEAPRQGVLATGASGRILLRSNLSPQSCEDLVGFDRIWLLYDFHNNSSWKEKVRPPRFSEVKRSVFSSRSPYRPNSIGMSCVKLDEIRGTELIVSDHDLLDGTPILDIKPYLPYADCFPEVETGWVQKMDPYRVTWDARVESQLVWLEVQVGIAFRQVLANQLGFEPTSSRAKRISVEGEGFVFSVKTWRFGFIVSEMQVEILSVYGGYSTEELLCDADPYGDKSLHRDFLNHWS